MSQEDKQFFDGMFVGAIIVGLVLVTIIAFFLFTSGQEVGENLSQPPDLIEEPAVDTSTKPIAEKQPQDDASGQLLDTIAISGHQYVVIQLLEHPRKDLMFRLLAESTDDFSEIMDQYSNSNYLTSFNGNTLFYTSENRPKHGQKVVFSFWTKNGQELVSIDEDNENMPNAPLGSVHVLKWLDENLILESFQGDTGFGFQDVFKYNPEDKTVSNLLSYQTGWYFNADTSTEIIYTTWANNERKIGQILDTKTGAYSNLYYLPAQDTDWTAHNKYLIAYQTTSEVGADIKSDHNLSRYSEGLEIIVTGENVFIPWTVK